MDMFDDAFGSGPATGTAQADPAAQFMQQEQADLGDLGTEFGLNPAPAGLTPSLTGLIPSPTMAQTGDGTSSFFEASNNDSGDIMGGLTSSGMPDLSSSGMTDLSSSGLPDLSSSGMPDFSSSAMPDLSSSGMPDIASSGMPDFSNSGISDLSSSGLPDLSTSGMPDFSSSAMPDLSSSGMPDIASSSPTDVFSKPATDSSTFGMSDMGGMQTPASSDMPDFSSNGTAEVSNSGMPDFSTENIGSDFGQSEVASVGAADPLEQGGPFETSRGIQRQTGKEPECIRKWKEGQKERIRIKDEEEAKKMEDLKQTTKMELESWYKNYDEELQLTKQENRVAEEAFMADVNGLKPGTEWERVCRNCDFNSKVNHNKKDRSRMRNVLLQLKQAPLMNRD